MKITNRMKKILLFLLHPEKTFHWFEKNKIPITKHYCYSEWEIMCFCAKKSWQDLTHSERVSYHRTFEFLWGHTLIMTPSISSHCFALTDKGRRIAKEIEKEIRDFIKEYEYLV